MGLILKKTFLEFCNGENTCPIGFDISPIDISHFHLGYLIKPMGKTILSLLNLMLISYFTKPYTEHITSQNCLGK